MDNNQEKGQAILELAIFGAILIMLLGILLNYGLRYGYQQQTMQFAFRKALQSLTLAGTPPTSHVIVRDRHIPNPSDPFGTGAVTAFSSGASVIRSNKLDESPDNDAEVPRTSINVERASIKDYTTAAFRWDRGDYKNSKRKFEEVYGVGNVWRIRGGDGPDWQTPLDWKTGEPLADVKNVHTNRPTYYRYLKWLRDYLPLPHRCPEDYPDCEIPDTEKITIAIIDYAWGQILDYDSAVRQCRLIREGDAFMTSCQRGGTSEEDCEDIWKKEEIDYPDYCEGCGERDADGRYVCAKLKQLFDNTRFRSMGLQEDYVQKIKVDNLLDKVETSSDITTTDRFNWQVSTDRKIFYHDEGVRRDVPVHSEAPAPGEQKRTRTWQTPW